MPEDEIPKTTPKSRREEKRLRLGEAAVFTARQAAELLPLSDDRCLDWLRRRGLVRCLDGRQVVIWGDFLEALRTPDPDTPPATPRPLSNLRRTPLGKAERWKPNAALKKRAGE